MKECVSFFLANPRKVVMWIINDSTVFEESWQLKWTDPFPKHKDAYITVLSCIKIYNLPNLISHKRHDVGKIVELVSKWKRTEEDSVLHQCGQGESVGRCECKEIS